MLKKLYMCIYAYQNNIKRLALNIESEYSCTYLMYIVFLFKARYYIAYIALLSRIFATSLSGLVSLGKL